jgi:hypothetical protein
MIIHNLDVHGFSILPGEANPVAVVDPDTVLPGAVITKSLKLKAGALQVMQSRGGVQDGELPIDHFGDGSKLPGSNTVEIFSVSESLKLTITLVS